MTVSRGFVFGMPVTWLDPPAPTAAERRDRATVEAAPPAPAPIAHDERARQVVEAVFDDGVTIVRKGDVVTLTSESVGIVLRLDVDLSATAVAQDSWNHAGFIGAATGALQRIARRASPYVVGELEGRKAIPS